MFRFLVTHSLRNRLLIIAMAAVLVLYGTYSATRLPEDVFPDLNKPTVTIITESEGLAPAEVEHLVTFLNETQMNGVPGVSRVRSVFRHWPLHGLCRVRVGHRHLPQPPTDRRAARTDPRSAPTLHCAADGSDQLHHGTDSSYCCDQRARLADGASRDCGLRYPAASSEHSRSRPGYPNRRRGPPVPYRAASRRLARARRHLRTGRKGARSVRRQHRRRLHRPAFARIPDPQHWADHQP